MKPHQIERLKTLINEIRNTTIYDSGDYPQEAEIGNYVLQRQMEKLKVAIHRIDDDFIKSQVGQIDSNFEQNDQPSAIFALNKVLPLLDEIEDYLDDASYNKIEIFVSSLKNNFVDKNNDKTLLQRDIVKGDVMEALNKMLVLFEKQNMPTNEGCNLNL